MICRTTPATMHILVSTAVRHRMYRLASASGGGERDSLLSLRQKYYHHRGKAITALDGEIRNRREPYLLMISAVTFVYAEVRILFYTWRLWTS